MTLKTFAVAGCAAAVALSGATSAFAQAPAAPAAAAPQVTHGAPIPGLCVVSIENAIGASTVGKYVNTRLQQLVGQVNAELSAERTAIDNDAKTLEGQRATLDQNALEQRAAALQVRANSLQRKAQLRDREIQATEQKAFNRVGTEMEPLIRASSRTWGRSASANWPPSWAPSSPRRRPPTGGAAGCRCWPTPGRTA